MADINNILFPTDFSENTSNALTFALEIARASDAKVHLMHSIEEPYNFAMMDEAPITTEVKRSISQTVKKLFNTLEDEIRKNDTYGELNIETSIQTGRAVYNILEEAGNRNADLVVVGAKGRTGLKKILFGSTTAEVIRRAEVPVLAVPKEASYEGFKQIIFATDYQDGDLEALQFVVKLAKLFNSKINIFHSSLKNNLKTEIMSRGFRDLVTEKISYDNIEFETTPSTRFFEAVTQKMARHSISLLVMVHYEESFPPLPKRLSQEMSYYSEAPLLVLPGQKLTNAKNDHVG
ncbi:Nucleotide-binding universal stress protein, UspA family [Fodinibius roseus]|uniref:Nucleotide-binding universal stress protein, UspA family n=1 Tax=Fodinibius roseus TaxID=1194090 RepID=A0A1M4XAD7_9BACT|nr:universal stress protein [Fodinibius roseus]SHE90393.1 Nucleotide-binding universal stress protein, UspA family [Fodinibius roseus]